MKNNTSFLGNCPIGGQRDTRTEENLEKKTKVGSYCLNIVQEVFYKKFSSIIYKKIFQNI